MVTIQLYDDIPFNNNDKMSNFPSLNAQNTYFENHADITLIDDCKFTGYEQPVLINRSFDDLIDYKYGRISVNGSDWVYFSINRFMIERENKTWLYMDIDVWETFRYRNNGLRIGRGHVTRCSKILSTRIKTALKPKFKNTKEYDKLRDANNIIDNYCLIVLAHDSNSGADMLVVASVSNYNDFHRLILPSTIHYIAQQINITDDDIIGAWLSPFRIDTSFSATAPDGWKDVSIYNMTIKYMSYNYFVEHMLDGQQSQIITLYSMTNPDDKKVIGITDLRDNLVWVSDNESSYNTGVVLSFNMSCGACAWTGYIKRDNEQYSEGLFTIPCETIDFFNDAFTLYNVQQRPFIEQQRAIQREQSLINSFSNIGQSAIMGGIGGNVAGAVAGAVIGAVGSGVQYVATDYYNKQYQNNEDNQARVQTDQLKVNGIALLDIIQEKTYCKVVTIESDDQSLAEYETDIATYGNYYDLETEIETMIGTNVKLTCSTNEVENIPSVYVGNIQTRLSHGVIFINPT